MVNPSTMSGTTRTVFTVANPIRQARAQQHLNRIWEERGVNIIAVPAQVQERDLPDFIKGVRANLSSQGAVVSVPHKQAVVELCDELGINAQVVGAVNTFRRTQDGSIEGETFDGLGFVQGLESQGVRVRGQRAWVLGAGGAASAIVAALAQAEVTSITIENRTRAKAQALIEKVRAGLDYGEISTAEDASDPSTVDLVVNATSLGMGEERRAPNFRLDRFPRTATAADVIVMDTLTPFLEEAEALGMSVHEGRHMLLGQIDLIARFLEGSCCTS